MKREVRRCAFQRQKQIKENRVADDESYSWIILFALQICEHQEREVPNLFKIRRRVSSSASLPYPLTLLQKNRVILGKSAAPPAWTLAPLLESDVLSTILLESMKCHLYVASTHVEDSTVQ